MSGGAAAAGAAAASAGAQSDGGDAGRAQQHGQGAQDGEQAQSFTPDAISSALGELVSGQDALRQLLAAEQNGDPEGEDGFGDDVDGFNLDAELGLGDDFADGYDGDDSADVAAAVGESVDRYVQAAMQPVQEALADQAQQLADERRAREYAQLAAELPELGDPHTVALVTEQARAIGDVVGLSAEQAMSPHVLRLVYLAGRAVDAAQEEEGREYSDGAGAAHLEGGGGAIVGGRQGDAFDRMMKQRRGSAALPFGQG